MKYNIIFKQKNPDYNKEYANEYHFGEESENNPKDLWSITYAVKETVTKCTIIKNGIFNLKAPINSGESIDLKISNMMIINCYDSNNCLVTSMAASHVLIDRSLKVHDRKHNIIRYYFYFNSNENFSKIGNGIFVSDQDIPPSLKKD